MKAIIISRRARLLNELFQQAREHNLILQSADGEQFVLARIPGTSAGSNDEDEDVQAFDVGESDDFEEEITLTRQNAALMRFLDERAAHVKAGEGTTLEEIRRRLGE